MAVEEMVLKDDVKLTNEPIKTVKIRRRSLKKQSTFYGCFMNDNIRPVDYVLVYENEENDHHDAEKRRNYFEQNLIKEGLELETETVKDSKDNLTFVKIHAPWNVLCRYGELLKTKMPLWVHEEAAGQTTTTTNVDVRRTCKEKLKDFLCCKDKKSDLFDPDRIIVWPFEKRHVNQFAVVDQESFFLNRQRIEITFEVLQKTPNDPSDTKKRGIESLLEHKIYESAYPLHEGDPDAPKGLKKDRMTLRQKLKYEWANWGSICRPQPLHDVRNYFGEKIGFYFAFMDFYVKALIVPSLLGLAVLMYGFIDAAMNEETKNICEEPENLHDPEETKDNIANIWMCPICQPPHCDAHVMAEEFCGQYLWSWRLDNEGSLFLSCVTCLWSILFLKFWRRRESFLACQWSTHDAEEYEEVIRPDYEERAVKTRRNPVTTELEPFIPYSKLLLWFLLSSLATFGLLCLAAAGLAGLVISRIALYGAFKSLGGFIGEKNVEFARWSIHGCIFIMVSIFETMYHSVAHKLTTYECPKTESKFMSSLLWKIFIFELLNDFVPIGYAAWLKGKTIKTPLDLNFFSELCDGGCMGEVTELVAVLLLARLIVGNIAEIGIPLLTRYFKKCRKKSNEAVRSADPQWRTDFHLEEAELDGVYDEYMEMMVQFAFIVLFIPALPAAAAVCFLNNIAEIRVDAFNIMFANRRPLPIRVPGIQIWNQFMDIICKLGVICNAGLIAFTSDNVVFFFYEYTVAPGSGGLGYTKFTLTSVMVEGWKESQIEEMKHNNVTKCYYADFREPEPPYELKDIYWQVFTIRVASFAAYCLVFFIIMWLVNTFIPDVPPEVKTKIKRREYVVHKAREAEAAMLHTKWADARHGQKEETNGKI